MAAWDENINVQDLLAHAFTELLGMGSVVVDPSIQTSNGHLTLTLDHVHKQSLSFNTYNLDRRIDGALANPFPKINNEESAVVPIFISGGSSLYFSLDAKSSDTVETVKTSILYEISFKYPMFYVGNHVKDIELQFNGTCLINHRTLASYGVQRDSVLYLTKTVPGSGDPTLLLDSSFLDPRYDYTYPNGPPWTGTTFQRGDVHFLRPYGWHKIGLRVGGKYENDIWLGSQGRITEQYSAFGEWPVSYHGTKRENVDSMIRDGYDHRRGSRYAHGPGIYSSPIPQVAEKYAAPFKYNGDWYKMMFMNRVNKICTHIIPPEVTGFGTYFVTANDKAVRPYAILLKKYYNMS